MNTKDRTYVNPVNAAELHDGGHALDLGDGYVTVTHRHDDLIAWTPLPDGRMLYGDRPAPSVGAIIRDGQRVGILCPDGNLYTITTREAPINYAPGRTAA